MPPPKKITEHEINALLEAFHDSYKASYGKNYQTRIFKLIIICFNIYLSTFLMPYFFPEDYRIFNDAALIAIDGRTQITFWFMVALNMSLHFNIGFKAVAITFLIYAVNSNIDNFILLSALVDLQNMPYVSFMILTSPLFAIGLIFLLILHKEE